MKKLLIFSLVIIMFASFASAAPIWDSQDEWTSDGASVPGWEENEGTAWNITELNAISKSADTQINKTQVASYIYFKFGSITADDAATFAYHTDASNRIFAIFFDTYIRFDGGDGLHDITAYPDDIVKIQTDFSATHYAIFINDTFIETAQEKANSKTQGYMFFDTATGGNTLNISWFCLDNDNVSCEFGGTPETSDSINLTSPFPINNSQFNTQTVNFNTTANASYSFNCSIYLNKTSNQTSVNYEAGTNVEVDFNITFGATEEKHYEYIIGCNDFQNNTNTSDYVFYVDLVDPVLTVDQTLSNNSSVSYGDTNITSSINVSDNNLWGINVTIDDTFVVFNITNLTTATYNYNLNFNPINYNLNEGEHILNVMVSDSHTTKEIPDYSFTKNLLSRSITYEFGDGWIDVEPTNTGLFSSFNTWKNKDRYVFEFDRDYTAKLLYGTDLEFEVTSSHKLELVDGEFPGHIISPDLKKWIDFDSQYKNAKVTSERINDKKIRVFIEGIEDDTILFNSIGGLNIVERNYTFYYGNVSESYISEAIETETTEFNLNITKNDSYVNNIDASLFWNGTYYTPTTKQEYSNYFHFAYNITSSLLPTANVTNHTFFWNYTIFNENSGNNITNESIDPNNQSIYKMIVSNCTNSVATTTSINFSVVDQILDIPAYVVSEASFTVWKESSLTTRTYGLNWDNSSSFNLCIYPDFVNLFTNYELVYTGYGDTNNRIRTNDTIDNSTEYVTLYIATEGEDISINIVNEDDDPIENLDIEAWLYDTADDNYTLIAGESTDPDGLAVLRLYTAGEDKYQFRVYDGTELLYTSSTFKIYQTSYIFRMVQGTIPNSTEIALQSLSYDLAIDKTNNNFTLTWDDSATGLISAINLTVVQVNATGNTRLSSQLSTSNSGKLFYAVSNNGTFIAYAYATASSDGLIYLLESLSHTISTAWDLFGTDTLIMSLIFIGTMAFVGLAAQRGGEISLILTIVAMIIFWMIGFIQVALSGIVSLAVAATVILVRLKKRQ